MKKSLIKIMLFLFISFYTNVSANIITLKIDSLDQAMQIISASKCDTIIIVNNTNYTDYFFSDTTIYGSGDFNFQIYPDSTVGPWGLETSYFNDISEFGCIVIAHQYHTPYYYINIEPCLIFTALTIIEKSIELFPNPAFDILYVDTDGIENSLEVLDHLGRVVITIIPKKQITLIDTQHLNNSLYYLRISDKKGRIFYRRFYKVNKL